jgi:hypothetical protein
MGPVSPKRPAPDLSPVPCLAAEWQGVVDRGLGDQDLTVVTQALEGHGGKPS